MNKKLAFFPTVRVYLNIMLSMPNASDLWIGSTDLSVAITFGMAAIKVNHIDMKSKMKKPGKNEHCRGHTPGVAVSLAMHPHW